MANEGKTVEKVSIAMGLATEGLDKDLQKVENTIVNGVSSIAKKIAGPLAAFFSFQAVAQVFGEMTNEMDALNKSSKQMGVSVDNLHAWQEAAKSAGGSAEGLNTSVSTLSKNLQMIDLNGKGSATPFLKELGIEALDSTGKARDAFEIMEEISGKIEGMDKQKSLGILQSLGLDSGSIMLLQSGKTNLQALLKEQKEIGVYTEKDTDLAGKYKDSLEKLSRTFKMSLLPIITKALTVMTTLTNGAVKGIRFLKEHITAFIPVLLGLGVAMMAKVVPAMIAMTGKFLAMSKAFLLSPLGMAVVALLAIGLAIEDLIVWMNGGKSAFDDFWEAIFGSREEAKAFFDNIVKWIEAFVAGLVKGFQSFVAFIRKLPEEFQRFKDTVTNAFNQIKTAVLNHLRPVIEIVKLWQSYIQLVVSAIDFLIEALFGSEDATDQAFNSMMEKWESFKSQCMSVVDSIADKLNWLFGLFDKAKSFVSGLNLPSFGGDFSSPSLALAGGGAMSEVNEDNRQISTSVNNTFHITNSDPRTTANLVAGNSKAVGDDITNRVNSGTKNM